ncbi:MAG: hypothetical protein QW039_00740 [Fervidicoccaceae archaeon]
MSKRNLRMIFIASILIFTLFYFLSASNVNAQSSANSSQYILIDFNGFGIASVKQTINVNDIEIVEALGKLLYINAVSPSNLTYYVENNTIVLVPPSGFTGTAEIDYVSQLAFPSGNAWISNFTALTNCTVLLPIGAIPLDVNPIPSNFSITNNNRLALMFPPGNISISYTLAAGQTTTSPPTQTTTQAQTSGVGIFSQFIYALLFIIIALIIAIVLLLRGRFFRSKG